MKKLSKGAFLFEDFNGDGRKDIFVGGARTQPAEMDGTSQWLIRKTKQS